MHEGVRAKLRGEGEGSRSSDVPSDPGISTSHGPETLPEGEQLVQLLERLTTISQELRPRLVRLVQVRISSRLQGRIDPEEVVQGALLRLVKSLRSSRPESEDQLRFWIYKKVWSQLQDEIRQQRTEGRDVDREGPLPQESVADLVGRMGVSTNLGLKDVIATIRQALDPDDFEIVCLRILDELSYGDIAELFETTADAVRKRYVRTLLKVRKTISDPFSSTGAVRG